MNSRVPAAVIAAVALGALCPSCGDDSGAPCSGVVCPESAHCVWDGYLAFCACDEGYRLVSGECLPAGDAGADADGDAGDSDAARDGDADGDDDDDGDAEAGDADDAEAGEAGPPCAAGEVPCGGDCADPSNDPYNCGTCGTICPALEVCGGGRCAADCPFPLEDCDRSCVDLRTDPDDCGECYRSCVAAVNATPWCAGGECAELCLPGFGNADGAPGCECSIVSPTEACNSIDDDCDGDTNCARAEPGGPCVPVCADESGWCDDSVDNDLDGSSDCSDPDCCAPCGSC